MTGGASADVVFV